MVNILKETGIISRTNGKVSNPYFCKKCSIPCVSLDNGDSITNPYDIANTFNDYFASIAETLKKSIKYSHKHFSKTIFQMKLVVQYFCNLLMKKK